MGRPFKARVGERFGTLTVRAIQGRGRGKNAALICDCSCGKTGHRVLSGSVKRVRSCGCRRYELLCRPGRTGKYHKLPSGEASFNLLYGRYRNSARKSHRDFGLSKEEFRSLVTANCFYCDSPPARECSQPGSNGAFRYNGIDRVDNARGYWRDNCVAACFTCNSMKLAASPAEFIRHVIRIAKNVFGAAQGEGLGNE